MRGERKCYKIRVKIFCRLLKAFQSQFSFGVSSPVGKNFNMKRWVDKRVNAWTEKLGKEMNRQIKLLNCYR